MRILSRHPGEWTCTTCDHHEYPGTALIPTQTWWRGPKPKICWRCVSHLVSHTPNAHCAANDAADAFEKIGEPSLSTSEIRTKLIDKNVSTDWATDGRFAAMVRRVLTDREGFRPLPREKRFRRNVPA